MLLEQAGGPVMQGHGWEWQKPQLLQHPSHGRLHSRARLLFSGPSVRQRTLHPGRRSRRKIYPDSWSL